MHFILAKSNSFQKTACFLVLMLFASFLAQEHIVGKANAQNDDVQPVMPMMPKAEEPGVEGFPRAEDEPPLPQVLQNHVRRGAQSLYLGQFGGLHGWAIVRGGKPEFHYVTRNGEAIVMGLLFDKNGNMITGEQLRMLRLSEGASTYKLSDLSQERQRQGLSSRGDINVQQSTSASDAVSEEAEEAPKTRAEKFYADVENANWIRMGRGSAPILYAFIDADCSHCQRFMKDVKPFIDRGVVQLRVLPVGFDENALKRSAYLLAAPEPMEQLYRYINGDEQALFVPGEMQTDGAVRNVRVLVKWKTEGTPILTYKDRDGVIRFVRGAPDNVAVIVDELER